MPEWEIHPFETVGDNSSEVQLEQIKQELESLDYKKEYLLAEKERLENENLL